MEKWKKIVDKGERELLLASLTEVAEKMRFNANLAVAFIGLYLALLALGVRHIIVDGVSLFCSAAALFRAERWRKVLSRIEDILSEDPAMGLADLIRNIDWDFAIVAVGVIGLMIAAVLIRLGLIP